MCRISPAPPICASGTVAPDFTTTKSAFPPDRSQLDARSEVTPGCNAANPLRGPPSCPQQIPLIISSTPKIRFTLKPSSWSLAAGKSAGAATNSELYDSGLHQSKLQLLQSLSLSFRICEQHN